jgi:hypothetical protein
MASINNAIIEQVIERVSGKLRQNRRAMDEAYTKCEGDLPVSLPVKFKPSNRSGAIDVEVGIKFKLDEVNEKDKYTLFDGPAYHEQKELEFAPPEGMEDYYEILFRDFRTFAKTLRTTYDQVMYFRSIHMRRFQEAA